MVRKILPLLLVLACLALVGCGEYGKVEQGRTVAFDKEKNTITFIRDDVIEFGKAPEYHLPPETFSLPTDATERGPDAKPGLRVKLDREKKIIIMFDPATKQFDNIAYTPVEEHDNVSVRQQHPLVYDAETKKARKFPVVNAEDKTVTIYSSRQSTLDKIKIPDASFAKYKEADWDAGDEVRVYFREQGKALRYMNVSKTDVTRR